MMDDWDVTGRNVLSGLELDIFLVALDNAKKKLSLSTTTKFDAASIQRVVFLLFEELRSKGVSAMPVVRPGQVPPPNTAGAVAAISNGNGAMAKTGLTIGVFLAGMLIFWLLTRKRKGAKA